VADEEKNEAPDNETDEGEKPSRIKRAWRAMVKALRDDATPEDKLDVVEPALGAVPGATDTAAKIRAHKKQLEDAANTN
jgi:hypothetical protein